jgi:hypothetical protein
MIRQCISSSSMLFRAMIASEKVYNRKWSLILVGRSSDPSQGRDWPEFDLTGRTVQLAARKKDGRVSRASRLFSPAHLTCSSGSLWI